MQTIMCYHKGLLTNLYEQHAGSAGNWESIINSFKQHKGSGIE